MHWGLQHWDMTKDLRREDAGAVPERHPVSERVVCERVLRMSFRPKISNLHCSARKEACAQEILVNLLLSWLIRDPSGSEGGECVL